MEKGNLQSAAGGGRRDWGSTHSLAVIVPLLSSHAISADSEPIGLVMAAASTLERPS